MNDRFKFRVWITAPITRDVEEEKEVSFYIYDIALYDDGGIGFSRDSLLDALDKLNLTEEQRNEIEDYISDNSYSEDWEWYAISFDRIEQCTGLKDKNGELIYENDLIKCPNGIYRIAVDDFGLWTAIYENNPLKGVAEWSDIVKNYAFNQENVELEILGNIHENPDLLGEE